MLPKAKQLTACGRLFADGRYQRLGMTAVGARQRNHNPGGTPAGKLACPHGRYGRFRQFIDDCQPASDPARMSTQPGRYLVLAELVSDFEFPQQRRLLKGIKLPGAVAGQKLTEGILSVAGPDCSLERVQAGAPGGIDPLVTVNEYKVRMLFGNHYDGDKLAVTHQRFGEISDAPRPSYAGMGIRELEMCNLNGCHGDGFGHGWVVSDVPAKVPRVISLQDLEFAKNWT